MELRIRPELRLDVRVYGKDGKLVRQHTSKSDPLTKWYRRWLVWMILQGSTPSDYATIKDTTGSTVTLSGWGGADDFFFYDIVLGKSDVAFSEDQYNIQSPASYDHVSYSVVPISEGSDGKITFGLSRTVKMKESTTLKEFGLIGRHITPLPLASFLVARDIGSVPVDSGLSVEARYIISLNKPAVGTTSGYTRWFNRALAAAMTGTGGTNGLAAGEACSWTPLELKKPGGTTFKPARLAQKYSPLRWSDMRFHTGTAAPTYDDYSLASTTVITTYQTRLFKVSETTGQTTLEAWEHHSSNGSYTFGEMGVRLVADDGTYSWPYFIHRSTPPAIGLSSGQLIRGYLKLVIS
jgi:hypothetical protein